MNNLIEHAFNKARDNAHASEYDRGVCILAISRAYDVFATIPIRGEPEDYLNSVKVAISNFQDNYNDPDGEYTNGTAIIGTLLSHLYQLRIGEK